MAVKEKKLVKQLPKYKAAKSIESVCREFGFQEKDIIKLAGNENRYGCSPKVIEALSRQASSFSFYPDVNVTVLRHKLAEKHQVSPEKLVFGNGSFELISLVGAAYIEEGDEVIYNDPSFGWYLNVTKQNGGKLIRVPVDEEKRVDTDQIVAHITEKTKVIWLCNPNNPTGTVLSFSVLEDLIRQVPERVLVVLDEAYIDFIQGGYPDTERFVQTYDNVILLRTFSKVYGLASFRIGYGIGNEKIVEALTKVKLPLNVSNAAQIAAVAALEDQQFTDFIVKTNQQELAYYYEEFAKLGLHYIESNGNFVLVKIGIDSAFAELAFLKRGIVIRNGEEFGLPGWLRISVGRIEENRKVIEVLKEVLKEGLQYVH